MRRRSGICALSGIPAAGRRDGSYRFGALASLALSVLCNVLTACCWPYGPRQPATRRRTILVHAIVEQELRLSRGFWATVAAGAIFASMSVRTGRLRPHARERSAALIHANGPYILQAEVLVSALLRVAEDGLDARPQDAAKQVREGQSAPPAGAYPIDAVQLVRVVKALREAAQRWRMLPDGGTLNFDWPLAGRRERPRTSSRVAGERLSGSARLAPWPAVGDNGDVQPVR